MADRTAGLSLRNNRTLGAVALLVIGVLHYEQFRRAFDSSNPRSAPLYAANFIVATGLALVLLVPVSSRLKPNGEWLDQLVARVGVMVAAGGLIATLASEHTPVFGFREHGYGFGVALALTLDVTAVVTLTRFVTGTRAALAGGSETGLSMHPACVSPRLGGRPSTRDGGWREPEELLVRSAEIVGAPR